MAYTAVSTYGYITGDDLEAFAANTYVSTDALFTEAVVMAQVTQAELWINEYCNRPDDPFTGTIPDGIKFATKHMAKFFMNFQMLENGHIEEMPMTLEQIIAICEVPLAKHKKAIDYSSSATDFDLRNRRD